MVFFVPNVYVGNASFQPLYFFLSKERNNCLPVYGFKGRNKRTYKQGVSSEKGGILHEIPVLEGVSPSIDSLYAVSCH